MDDVWGSLFGSRYPLLYCYIVMLHLDFSSQLRIFARFDGFRLVSPPQKGR